MPLVKGQIDPQHAYSMGPSGLQSADSQLAVKE